MATLKNTKHERFAQELAAGKTADEAYQLAGYSENRGNATRLKANESIRDRVAEILGKAAERVEVDRAWVLGRLVENVNRAMQAEAVTNADGAVTGEYKYEGSVANRALELVGKELGMFVDRTQSTVDMTVAEPVDRPPRETHEQWTSRRRAELGAVASGVGAPARPANGRYHG